MREKRYMVIHRKYGWVVYYSKIGRAFQDCQRYIWEAIRNGCDPEDYDIVELRMDEDE